MKNPHRHVYSRLGPSKIDGVGVFAIRDIKKGTDIFPDIDDEIIWISKVKVQRLRGEIRKLYEDYCVKTGDNYGAPVCFNRINVSWYLNHSFQPNAYVDQDYHVFAKRNIKKGEEITLDYTTFMDVKIPKRWR
jgi:SET domain-containing protein